METLRPIFWGQGMFLRPQHFQQQDVYHAALLHYHTEWLMPFAWGIRSLRINTEALKDFTFDIQQCELMTREGTVVRFQGPTLPSNTRIAARRFEALLDFGEKPLGVYLGLKRWQWEGANIAYPAESSANGVERREPLRFSLQESTIPDLLTGDGRSCAVQYLLQEMQILFEPELAGSAQGYEVLKIAEVRRAGQGAMLSEHYIPPALSVHASALLRTMLEEFRDALTDTGRELAEHKARRLVGVNALGPLNMRYVLTLQMVNRYIPVLHHHLELQETTPVVLYALLRQLIGEFSTFSATVPALGAPPLPMYRHDHLWECFHVAIRLARRLLAELTPEPEDVVSLHFDGTYFSANIEKRFFDRQKDYYLAVETDTAPNDLRDLLTTTGKICAREEIEEIRRLALSGLRVDYVYVHNLPDELPRRQGCSYFKLDQQHERFWRGIEDQQNMAVYCPPLDENSQMRLMILQTRE